MAQGPQIISTPTKYLDLTNIPLQVSHLEVYDKNRRVLLRNCVKTLPPYHNSLYKK